MPSPVEVFEGIAVCTQGDAVLVTMHEGNTLARSRFMWSRVGVASARNGSCSGILVVAPGTAPPDAEARKHAVEQLTRARRQLRRFVTVLEGDSLWLNIVRTVTRGLTRLGGVSDVSFVVDSKAAGVDLLLQVAEPSTPSRAELFALLAANESALREWRSAQSRP